MCGGKYHGSNNKPGGIEQAVKDHWEEVVSEAEKKAEAEGLELDTSGIRKLIGLEDKTEKKSEIGSIDNNHKDTTPLQGSLFTLLESAPDE
jgi:hypothetical protein